jgi:hypothetical protein
MEEVKFAYDSLLEGAGFEPSVPRGKSPTLRVSVLFRSEPHGSFLTRRWREMDSNFRFRGNRYRKRSRAAAHRKRKLIRRQTKVQTVGPLARNRCFESISLQQGVQCEPDFRGRIASMTVGDFARASDRQRCWQAVCGRRAAHRTRRGDPCRSDRHPDGAGTRPAVQAP